MRAVARHEAEPLAPLAPTHEPYAMLLPEACRRLGLSLRAGNRLVAEGRFPVPELPQLGVRRHRYSSVHVEAYLRRVHGGRG